LAVLAVAVLLGLVLALRWANRPKPPAAGEAESAAAVTEPAPIEAGSRRRSSASSGGGFARVGGPGEHGAAAAVADRLAQFAQARRAAVEAYARESGITVSPEVDSFLKAVEANDWDQVEARYLALKDRIEGGDPAAVSDADRKLWPAVMEAYGVAQVAHTLPPAMIENYGQMVLGALPAKAVYLGGSDAAQLIPTLMGQAQGADERVILNQNRLADASYLDYVMHQYGDRLKFPTEEQRQALFQDIVQAYGKRTEEGTVQVSGQEAANAYNRALVQKLVENNPELSFAMHDASAWEGQLYAQATVQGPLILLGGPDKATGVDNNAAMATAKYWLDTGGTLATIPELVANDPARAAYADLMVGQASLLASQHQLGAAELVYRTAQKLAPQAEEPTAQLALHLGKTGRTAEALQMLESFAQANPGEHPALEKAKNSLTPPAAPAP
jgi:hypothetical protein